MPSNVFWLPFAVPRTFERNGHPSYRHDIAIASGPFQAIRVDGAAAPVRYRVRHRGRTHQVREYDGSLFRRVTDAFRAPATLDQLERADTGMLVEGAAEHFWLDHPGAWRRDLLPREDPHATAILSTVEKPRFWRRQESEEAVALELQRKLHSCIVVDDGLWRPTAAPGTAISAGGHIEWWLSELPGPPALALHLDRHEVKRLPDLLASLGQLAEENVTYRYTMHSLRGGSDVQPLGADLMMLRAVLRAVTAAGSPSVASLGVAVAAAFWNGRRILEAGDVPAAQDWYHDAVSALSGIRKGRLALAVDVMKQRLELLSS